MFPLGFKARVNSLIHTWKRQCDLCSMRFTSGVTPSPVYMAPHSSQLLSPHECCSRGRMPDLNGRPHSHSDHHRLFLNDVTGGKKGLKNVKLNKQKQTRLLHLSYTCMKTQRILMPKIPQTNIPLRSNNKH